MRLGISCVGSSLLCLKAQGTKFFSIQSTAAFSPLVPRTLLCPGPDLIKGAGFDLINLCHVREERTGTGTANVVIYLLQGQILKRKCNTGSIPSSRVWPDRKSPQTYWVTTVWPRALCTSRTNLRAISSLLPEG